MTRAQFFESITAAVATATGASAAQPKEVKPGQLYALEFQEHMDPRRIESIRKALKPFEEKYGVGFMVLTGGATLRDPKAPVVNINAPSLSDEDIAAIRREFKRAHTGPYVSFADLKKSGLAV